MIDAPVSAAVVSPRGRTWSRAGLLLGAVLLSDQFSKAVVKDRVALGSEDSVFPLVTLVHTKNRGVAFSALEDQTAIVIAVISVALLALVAYVWHNAARPGIWVPAGLLLGGALGNVVDRIRDGEVTDFIKLPGWPAFNGADIAITFGVLALLYVIEKEDALPTEATAATSQAGGTGAADGGT